MISTPRPPDHVPTRRKITRDLNGYQLEALGYKVTLEPAA
jgi:hypothetical protein